MNIKKVLLVLIGIILCASCITADAQNLPTLPSPDLGGLDFSLSNSIGTFTIHGTYNYRYQIQESYDLQNWHAVSDVVTIPPASLSLPVGTNAHAFYRFQEFLPSELIVSTDPSSPAYTVVPATSSDVVEGVYSFSAPYEAMNITRLGLHISSGSPGDIADVSVWDGATEVGIAIFIGTNTDTIAVFNPPVVVPQGANKTLTIRMDVSPIGVNQPAIAGDVIKIDCNASTTQAVGTDSGRTVVATGATSVSGVRIYRSIPQIALQALLSNGVLDGRLMTFSATSSGNGGIGYGALSFSIATTRASVLTPTLYCYTDVNCTVPIFGTINGNVGTLSTLTNGISICRTRLTNGQPVEVPSGTTYYFQLRGTVVPDPDATTYSVTTGVLGDILTENAQNLDIESGMESAGSRFVWSPNDATNGQGIVSSLTVSDWSDGTGIPGLPYGGLLQARTN